MTPIELSTEFDWSITREGDMMPFEEYERKTEDLMKSAKIEALPSVTVRMVFPRQGRILRTLLVELSSNKSWAKYQNKRQGKRGPRRRRRK